VELWNIHAFSKELNDDTGQSSKHMSCAFCHNCEPSFFFFFFEILDEFVWHITSLLLL
jgi:hypothetical protein